MRPMPCPAVITVIGLKMLVKWRSLLIRWSVMPSDVICDWLAKFSNIVMIWVLVS